MEEVIIFAPYLNTDGQCLFVDGPDLQIQQRSELT